MPKDEEHAKEDMDKVYVANASTMAIPLIDISSLLIQKHFKVHRLHTIAITSNILVDKLKKVC